MRSILNTLIVSLTFAPVIMPMTPAHEFNTITITLILLLASQGCTTSAVTTPEDAAAPTPPALVRVDTVRKDSVAPEFRALGNVRPRHFSVIASGSDGIVAEFPVEVGEFVTVGTLLSKLRMESTDLDLAEQEAIVVEREADLAEIQTPRSEDVAEAQARLQGLEITYANAERRLEELRALNKRGAANPSEVKDAEDTFDAERQNLVAAKAVFQRTSTGARPEQKQQAAARLQAQTKHVEFLKAEREKRMTKAPFDGFVVAEHTNVGQWLAKGASIVTLAQLDEVEVQVQIDQQFIDQITAGRPVTLMIQGTGNRNGEAREWKGEVSSIVPRSNWEDGSRSFPVIIRIKNEIDASTMPPIPALREGMVAEAEFRGQPIDALLVPKDSMVRTSRGTFIFVVNPPAEGQPLSVRQVMVEPGLSSGTSIQVIGENLEPGMQVVTEGAERLRAFQTVEIMKKDSGVGIQDSGKKQRIPRSTNCLRCSFP